MAVRTKDPRVGVNFSVRGWVQCSDGQEELVWDVVERHQDGFYTRGWSILTGPNGDTCVFYCGTMREQAMGWFLDQLRDIASIPSPIDEDDRIRGLVTVQLVLPAWRLDLARR